MKKPDGRCLLCKRPGYTHDGTTLKYVNSKPRARERIHLYTFRRSTIRSNLSPTIRMCSYCVRNLITEEADYRLYTG